MFTRWQTCVLGQYTAGLGGNAHGGRGGCGGVRPAGAAFDLAAHYVRVFTPCAGVAAVAEGLKGGDQMVFTITD